MIVNTIIFRFFFGDFCGRGAGGKASFRFERGDLKIFFEKSKTEKTFLI